MLVLASGSPRRLELLRSVGLSPVVDVPNVPEIADSAFTPVENARRFAARKASIVTARRPDDTILAADTIVTIDGLLLGKPTDARDARRMLDRLAGRRHEVVTCVRIEGPGAGEAELTGVTTVALRPTTPEELDAYVDGDEWRDKAGAYAIQGMAACFVSSIEGSYTNVVGLPLSEVIVELRRRGALPSTWGPRERR